MVGKPQITSRKDLDLELILPMELIRQHTKTDDVINVTDEQLALYRGAAFEAAELFTNTLWTGLAVVQEHAEAKPNRRMFRKTTYMKLAFPTIDGVVSLFGLVGGRNETQSLRVQPGTRKIYVPTIFEAMDVTDCCHPERGAVNFGLNIIYRTGTANVKDVPEGIKVGCLKYIAWSHANPGDELLTVRNRLGTTETGLIGTNDAAWASGAVETWRRYRSSR